MDYTKFLGKKEHVVLAYLGGAYVVGKDRRLRVEGARPALGFHRFEVSGRNARALEAEKDTAAIEPMRELAGLPKARGHHVRGWLVHGTGVDRLALLPEEEPPPLAVARARRWHSGDFIFESLDFDSEVENEARLRLERGDALLDLKGVPATLRQAFGIALAIAAGERMLVPLGVREITPHAARIADEGQVAARDVVTRIGAERAEAAERARIRALLAGAPIAPRGRGLGSGGRGAALATPENAVERAEAALEAAHARMLASRRISPSQLEVTFEFMGERFISVVDSMTLQVHDSGVCLAGEDDLVTLESLPGVLREAIDTGRLVITRR